MIVFQGSLIELLLIRKLGIVPKSFENFGIRVKIVGKGKEAVCAVKRLGVFSDNESTLELRVGDTFVFYISKGD